MDGWMGKRRFLLQAFEDMWRFRVTDFLFRPACLDLSCGPEQSQAHTGSHTCLQREGKSRDHTDELLVLSVTYLVNMSRKFPGPCLVHKNDKGN